MIGISSILEYGIKAKDYFDSGVPLTVSVTNDTEDQVLHPNGFYAKKVNDNEKYDLTAFQSITATTAASYFDPVINPLKTSLAAFNTSKFSSASAVCFELEVRNKHSLETPYTIRAFYNWAKEDEATQMYLRIRRVILTLHSLVILVRSRFTR
ncbi:hypothetical protein AT251_19905 [Enterovibrio nigricans]|nr:hypothetical protein [Enterovibrio nigricans]PKF49304.1 hypothetical protein AT251_19905 [Enterovibrio nigricans]